MTESGKTGILMVCRGNICRSPIAEAVLVDLIKNRGLEQKYFVDSCATCKRKTHSRNFFVWHYWLEKRGPSSLRQRLLPAVHSLGVWYLRVVKFEKLSDKKFEKHGTEVCSGSDFFLKFQCVFQTRVSHMPNIIFPSFFTDD